MSLKSCRECNEQVSTEASTCPKCGVKNPTKKQSNIGTTILAIGAIVLIFSVFSNKQHATNAISSQVNDRNIVMRDSTGAVEESPCPESIATTPAQRIMAVSMVRGQGYDCMSVFNMCKGVWGENFTLICYGGNGSLYNFKFENHGGRWSIKAD